MEYGSSNQEIQQRGKKELLSVIADAQEKLDDWSMDHGYYAMEHAQEEIQEKYKELGGQEGVDNPELMQEAEDEVIGKYKDEYAGDANKYLNYLGNLADVHEGHNQAAMPNPNDRHGGLPSYADLTSGEKTESLPGALSSWAPVR
jgi:hypothetical protein